MLRHFLLSVFLISVLTAAANAQSSTDTTVKHTVDTTIKHTPADTIIKHAPTDTSTKHVPVDTILHSTIKTINDVRYNAYLKGEDWDNMSLAGELNYFPLPDKVLKLKKELELSPAQVIKLKELTANLHRKKLEMGVVIIRNEKVLDNLFRTKQVDEGSLIFYTNRSGLYYGELKGAILMACFNAQKLLTAIQVRKLETMGKLN
jgi:hypothetical protein